MNEGEPVPKKSLPRIVTVKTGAKPMTLRVRWQGSDEDALIDVSGMIGAFRLFEPLRRDPSLFRRVQLGDYGTDVVWPGDVDMSADTLWRLAQEQNGATISAEAFRQWRHRHEFTLEGAARALGISRRMVAYYEEGKKPIPRVVALATRGIEVT